MKKLPLLLLIACLIQGLTACRRHRYNPKAIKLNDSAVALIVNPPRAYKKVDSATMIALIKASKYPPDSREKKSNDSVMYVIDSDSVLYAKAIGLLNKAIQIDSNYSIAYFNKFGFQCHLKRYNDALATGKQLIRLGPYDGTIRYLVGMVYEIKGDTASARHYYQTALSLHDKALSSMDTNSKRYNRIKVAKAMDLVMLGRTTEAHEIFQALYNAADEKYKWEYKYDLTKTRNDFLNELKPEDPIIIDPYKK